MTKVLLLIVSLVLCAGVLLAQEQTRPGMNKNDEMSPTSVEGCLQGANGSFTLTDNTGKTYQLEADAAQLSEHVGHEVRVTGTLAGSSGSMAGGATQPTLQVKSLKHISKSCKDAGKMKK
jgi:hypothetical protein